MMRLFERRMEITTPYIGIKIILCWGIAGVRSRRPMPYFNAEQYRKRNRQSFSCRLYGVWE